VRAPKPCGHHGCPETVTGRTYCDQHEADRQRIMASRRGTTAERGYGSVHQAMRRHYAPTVRAGKATCWRCGKPIRPGQQWDVGHDDHDRTITRGPEHARRADCPEHGNRATSGRTPPRGTPSPPPRP
jgi:hypothetical protein